MTVHDEIRQMSDEKSINESFSVQNESVDERTQSPWTSKVDEWAGCPLKFL